jgi:membrane-associated phospholipid phosphatase
MIDPHCCRRGLLLPAALLLAAIAALGADLPVAVPLQRLRREATSDDTARTCLAYLGYLDDFEPFGHGLGLVLVIVAFHQLDRARRWAIPRVLACALAAGGVADLLKMLVIRIRPNDLPFPFPDSVWKTFGDWWPMLSAASEYQSFPSAHTATAVGLAAALIWLYPQGRWLFVALAGLVGCQRIASGAHYPSDVLLGAAAGCLVAALLLSIGWLPQWLSACERRWGGPPVVREAGQLKD